VIGRWLEQRRDGVEQTPAEIAAFVAAATARTITDAQIGAWLAFVCARGMTARETVALTLAMRDSGRVLDWEGIAGPRWDKHSTGGVGDKVSLVLAPLWAALGVRVPMISGRSLGITGGTLDKLEAIPGFRTDLPTDALRAILADVGCFIVGQSADLAPADRVLYALRDETQTVPSVPLITASILSKKLAEGIERLVLDVKHGSGAFMKELPSARALAASLEEVGRGAGLAVEAVLTPMEEPLGRAVGNALEVAEAVATLHGGGPPDLVELVVRLSGSGVRARAALRDGSAWQRWRAMVRAQGGDPDAPLRGGEGLQREELRAESDGVVTRCDAGEIGRAALALGAGRTRAGAEVHPGVGIVLARKRGEPVRRGEPLATLHHAGRGREQALAHLRASFAVTAA
jgi:pyrimidine-nucleoside phosphorylase